MSQILSTKNNNFKIYDEFEKNNLYDPHYLVKITIKELQYENGNHYYNIYYNYEFISSSTKSEDNNNLLKLTLHPFYNKKCIDSDGVIVFKNEMVTKMVEYLLMSDPELESNSGLSTSQNYRVNIMNSLALFWD